MSTSGTRPVARRAMVQGHTLVFALGILALLVVFGSALVMISRVEAAAATLFVHQVRAQLAARSGLAYSRLLLRQAVTETLRRKGEELKTATGATVQQGGAALVRNPAEGEFERWAYNARGTPFSEVPEASCSYRGSVGEGPAGSTGGSRFRVKVLDCASMLDLNHPNPESLRRTLRTLFEELKKPDGTALFTTAVAGYLANSVVDYRSLLPGDRYLTKASVTGALGPQAEQWPRLADYLTVSGWRDATTVRPPRAARGTGGTITAAQPVWTTEAEILEPRSPVNINTAPREVLVALLSGIAAVDGTTIDRPTARSIASAIIRRRRGGDEAGIGAAPYPSGRTTHAFVSWEDFNGFVLGLALTDGQRDLLKAHFNPNTDLNRTHPDDLPTTGNDPLYKTVDKLDLAAYSAEFCFNSMGYYELSSAGELRDANGALQAAQELVEVVRLFDVHRDTTQRDFETNRLSVNAIFRTEPPGSTDPDDIKEIHFGVLSAPEYCNFFRMDGVQATTTGKPAVYDGHLMLNELVLAQALSDDLLLDFARGRVEPFIHPDYVSPVSSLTNEQAALRKRTLINAAPESRSRGLLDVGAEDSASPRTLFAGGQPVSKLFSEGCDLTPMGLVVDREQRAGRHVELPGKYHAGASASGYFPPSHNPGYATLANVTNNFFEDFGTISFWVKPLKISTTMGERFTYFYWGSGDRNSTSQIENSIEVYQQNNRLYLAVRMTGPNADRSTVGPAASPPPAPQYAVGGTYNGNPITLHQIKNRDLWPSPNWDPLASGNPPYASRTGLADPNSLVSANITGFWRPGAWYHIAVIYGIQDQISPLKQLSQVKMFYTHDISGSVRKPTIVNSEAIAVQIPPSLALEEYLEYTTTQITQWGTTSWGRVVPIAGTVTTHKVTLNINQSASFLDNPRGRNDVAPGHSRFVDGPVVVGAGMTAGGEPTNHARAVFDNVFVQHFIKEEYRTGALLLPTRYFDQSVATTLGTQGSYAKRLNVPTGLAGTTLGGIGCTAYSDPSFGSNTVRVSVLARDSGASASTASTPVLPGEELFPVGTTGAMAQRMIQYQVDMGAGSFVGLNATPVVDDVTLYFMRPEPLTVVGATGGLQ